MSLKTHFLLYGAFALLSIIFVIASYSSEYDWASTSGSYVYANGCTTGYEIDTGLFNKKYSITIESCNNLNDDLTSTSSSGDLDCSFDDDNSSGCYALRSAQNGAKASIAFAVLKFLSVLWPLYLVWKGDDGINLNQLKSAGLCQLLISFMFMVCCFTTTGNYRNFLFDETSVYVDGVIYSVIWDVGSSWYLMLFAGLFNIGMMVYSVSLLFSASRASRDRPEVFATAVIVTPPPTAEATINPVGAGAYNPPQTHTQRVQPPVVQGRVMGEGETNTLNKDLV